MRRKKKLKPLSREQQIKEYRRLAKMNYAIAALWKRMARNWNEKAEELAKEIKE